MLATQAVQPCLHGSSSPVPPQVPNNAGRAHAVELHRQRNVTASLAYRRVTMNFVGQPEVHRHPPIGHAPCRPALRLHSSMHAYAYPQGELQPCLPFRMPHAPPPLQAATKAYGRLPCMHVQASVLAADDPCLQMGEVALER